MFHVTKKEFRHALMALAGGAGVFMAEAVTITSNPWVDAGLYAGMATLAGLGVGIARRTPAP